ncbi:hypothetical protein ICW40_03430 [Actinotalea ferrariae]|uniref:hypothetical protein n=1 Tax=Actinotalea ferrariae TaxID=1386098 RepID=UPI001C8C6533|nr:hypothetical protein [Actinotalea ferrariae]MBX9243856.1 hypothetical protein [Actinotalea ferrariae]
MSTPTRDDAVVSTLTLLQLPHTFTQTRLMTSSEFRREAKTWGHRLSDGTLQELEGLGLLVPFFRAQEPNDPSVEADDDARTLAAEPARGGRLIDPCTCPTGPDSAAARERLFSCWQLLALRGALQTLSNRRGGFFDEDAARLAAVQERSFHIALEALTNRFFPAIVGKWTAPSGSTFAEQRRAGRALDASARLAAVGSRPTMLQEQANWLLSIAHHDDPLGGWWQVVRHSNHRGWFKLKGAALQAVWQRIAAEVLLRAHEELAERGDLLPLPEPAGDFWHPFMDRIGATDSTALTLDHALTQLAVSPHPLVVVVVEGATEHEHMTALLKELGLGQRVRVVNQQTSGDRPHQLAGFLAPQIRAVLPDRQILERNPTPIFVVMDPENVWSPEKRDETVWKLRNRIREEVQRQEGGAIRDEELDELLKVRVWPDARTYEMANFTDGELVDALLAVRPDHIDDSADLRTEVLDAVEYARTGRKDFGVALGRLRWGRNLKVAVAQVLTPVLVSKLGQDAAAAPPVVKLALEIAETAERMAVGRIHLAGAETEPDRIRM